MSDFTEVVDAATVAARVWLGSLHRVTEAELQAALNVAFSRKRLRHQQALILATIDYRKALDELFPDGAAGRGRNPDRTWGEG